MFWRIVFWLWSAAFSNNRKAFGLVESTGIIVFVGPNGSGKSLVMVETMMATLDGRDWFCLDVDHRHHRGFVLHAGDCDRCSIAWFRALMPTSLRDLEEAVEGGFLCAEGGELIRAGSAGQRDVYSTVSLLEAKGVPHQRFRALKTFQQLVTIEHADVLFDEVAGIADSSSSGAIPVQVVNWMHQLRKRDVRLRVTTPAYARCALPIRQVAQLVVECRSFAPSKRPGLLWRPRRIVKAAAYDAWSFDDYIGSDGQRGRLRAAGRLMLWVPDTRAITTYNTLGQVLQLGHVTEGGMCMVCGGSRPRPKCGCDDDLSDEDLEHVHVVTEVTAAGGRVKRGVLVDATS